MLFRGGLGSQGLLGAVYQSLLVGIRESGGRVHREIEPRRHITLFHLSGDVFGVPLRAVPFGKIQMAAPAVHISLE